MDTPPYADDTIESSSYAQMRFQNHHHHSHNNNNSNHSYHNDSINSSSSHISKLVAAASDPTSLARSRDLFIRSLRHTTLPLLSSSLGGNTTGAATGGAPGSTHNIQRNPSPFTLRACAAHALVEGTDTHHQRTLLMHPTIISN